MGVTDEQIQRIYERLDDIERSLETRLRALEIWQAYQTGRLTALAVFFSGLGALVVGTIGFFARHLRMLAAVVAGTAVLLLAGCASAPKPGAVTEVMETAGHVASATEYVERAQVSAGAARRGLAKIKAACAAVPAGKPAMPGGVLSQIEEGRAEAETELEAVTFQLSMARQEQDRTRVALRDTQTRIDSLEAYNVCLTKDRDAAVQRADGLKKENDRLGGRLARLALALAGCAAFVVWLASRAVGLKALPVPYCYACPGLAAAVSGAAVFVYLRYGL